MSKGEGSFSTNHPEIRSSAVLTQITTEQGVQHWCNLPYAVREGFSFLKLLNELPNAAPEIPGWVL